MSAIDPAETPIEVVNDGDAVVAIILRSTYSEPGVHFFSEGHFSQQLGFIGHAAGHLIPPHVHNEVPREVLNTQETLFIRKGSVRVDLYSNECVLLVSRVLGTGDVILLATGGHGFEILEDSEIIEVKQGPYAGVEDKVRFEVSG